VVLPVPKIASPANFSDYRPISLLVWFSKIFEVLMARQMEAHIRNNGLLTVFQSGFRRHHSTTAVVLKVTEDIQSNLGDGHELLLNKMRNLQNCSRNTRMFLQSYDLSYD
jgi:hypothetical protein